MSIDFDGVDDQLDYNPGTAWNSLESLTACCWFYPQDSGAVNQNLLSKWDYGGGATKRLFTLHHSSVTQTPRVEVYNSNGNGYNQVSGRDWRTGEWNFICFSYVEDDKVYLSTWNATDGWDHVATGTILAGRVVRANSTVDFVIASQDDNNNYFDGQIAEVACYEFGLPNQADREALRVGFRPPNCLLYVRGTNAADDMDLATGLTATVASAPIDGASHPPVIYPSAQILQFPPAAAVGVTGTGALTAQAAAVAGTGQREITGTGALTSQAAAVSGTGLREITGTAALAADAATVAGAGLREITGTGALVADASIVAGAGTVGAVVTGTGALTAQDSAIAATGLREITGTAALTSDAATIAGTGLREITGTAALVSDASAVAASGTVGNVVAGTGALAAQSAAIAGAGIIGRTGTGALTAQAATIAGTGTLVGNITGTGALIAPASTVAGVGIREITGTGALASQAASVYGAEVVVVYDEIELAVTIARTKSLNMTITREVST